MIKVRLGAIDHDFFSLECLDLGFSLWPPIWIFSLFGQTIESHIAGFVNIFILARSGINLVLFIFQLTSTSSYFS